MTKNRHARWLPGVLALAFLLLGSPQAGRAQTATQISVAEGYGVSLSKAAQAMHYASDVSFEGGRVHARAGVTELGSGKTAAPPPATVATTEVPLQIGAWYAVNDRDGRTYLLRVLGVEQGRTTVTVAGTTGTPMRLAAARAGEPAPAVGRGVPMPTYGGVPMPTYGSVPAPTYGSVPMPKSKDVPAQPAGRPDTTRAQAAAPPPPRSALPPLRGETLEMPVFNLRGNELRKYYFRRDGTFQRQYIGVAALGTVSRSEHGDYAIAGDQLTVRVWSAATAASGGIPGERYQAAGRSDSTTVERHRFRRQGTAGVIIDGVLYKRMTEPW